MKKIEYLIKHNRFIQLVYRVFFSTLFSIITIFVPIKKNLVLISSFSGKKFNDSPKVIFEAMKDKGLLDKYVVVWALDDIKKFPGFPYKFVKINSFKYFFTAFRAKYWITNVNIERGLHFKKRKQIYLNTWHGTGPKTIGNAATGRKDYNFKKVNYLCADGLYLKNIFLRDFNAKEENIILCGRPREDILFLPKEKLDVLKNELIKKYNFPSNKKLILFAPTWRESSNKGKSFDVGFNFDLKHWADVLGNDYVILFRAHSITNEYNVPNTANIIDVTDIKDINDLYIVSDILVSDYSSCFTDFSILEKPMLCYCPDYESYKKERGLVYDLEPYFTDGVVKTEEKLLQSIKNINLKKEITNSKKYKETFISCNGHATEKCLKLLFSK